MVTMKTIEDFLNQSSLAVVGASRTGKKFGNIAYRELKSKGYSLQPVHPEAEEIEGDLCVKNLQELRQPVGGLLVIVPPDSSEKVVREAAAANIRRVWLQQGAESVEAIRFCEENGIDVIHGECVLMYAQPTSFHRFHRWLWGLLGKRPK